MGRVLSYVALLSMLCAGLYGLAPAPVAEGGPAASRARTGLPSEKLQKAASINAHLPHKAAVLSVDGSKRPDAVSHPLDKLKAAIGSSVAGGPVPRPVPVTLPARASDGLGDARPIFIPTSVDSLAAAATAALIAVQRQGLDADRSNHADGPLAGMTGDAAGKRSWIAPRPRDRNSLGASSPSASGSAARTSAFRPDDYWSSTRSGGM